MEPVVGIDVAKRFSVVQAFFKRNEPYGKALGISHEKDGFEQPGKILMNLYTETSISPVVVLEATGYYHLGLIAYLERNGWTYFIVNPLQSKRAKNAQLRKVKTDAADAWHLAEMYYRGDVTAHRIWNEGYKELQHMTRQHEFVTGMFVQAKLNMRALLDQVFPEYEKVFGDLFSETSLHVLARCLEDQVEDLQEIIQKNAGKSHSQKWAVGKVEYLNGVMSRWREQPRSRAQTSVLRSMVDLVLAFTKQLNELEKQMAQLSTGLPEVELVKSIPGIGEKLAAVIVAEIGDVRQFKEAKQLVAFAGLDPGIFSSGKFTATSTRITKRGSKRLRRALYLAVQCGIRGKTNLRLRTYYDKKRKEGKPYKVVVIACANKLLHHVYAILSKQQPFQT
ncbi:IS110 family transposase [Paenibacillus melissococcoides]|uniref:IS110 family transposase n=1 Tax=Paenibacillus melissococcoides TaxID=2912268 RepID=A0ABN8UFP3_9BACL|nr:MULTISPECIES: IS110 family transposase [Paenibacillus]MEB9898038.1 IS110 family transposase [Bacillus cereus]GIO78986.1 IS110 family transposase [Paenibacillus dendritiformis]CAH8249515.1 IS110 family transposase [Paenibacillus melissococcoides]CAH8721153.1 IS110 family transposase [Paenibacillus melissococcoides]